MVGIGRPDGGAILRAAVTVDHEITVSLPAQRVVTTVG